MALQCTAARVTQPYRRADSNCAVWALHCGYCSVSLDKRKYLLLKRWSPRYTTGACLGPEVPENNAVAGAGTLHLVHLKAQLSLTEVHIAW